MERFLGSGRGGRPTVRSSGPWIRLALSLGAKLNPNPLWQKQLNSRNLRPISDTNFRNKISVAREILNSEFLWDGYVQKVKI